MLDSLDTLKKLILAITALLALAPTASLLSSLVDVPPDFKDVLVLCTAVVGPMTFLLVLLMRNWLLGLQRKWLIALVCGATLSGLWAFWDAYETTNRYIVVVPYSNEEGEISKTSYVRPYQPTGHLAGLVESKYNGDWTQAIIGEDGRSVQTMMNDQAGPVRSRILISVGLAQLLLLFAFFAACWTAMEVLRSNRAAPRAAS